MDAIVASHKTEGEMKVFSPIDGRVTERVATPGLLLQPGETPAPVTVADLSSMWVYGYVAEGDVARVTLGAPVRITLNARPDAPIEGHIDVITPGVDPGTRRATVRVVVPDPKHELQPQMFATLAIRTGAAERGVAVPAGGVVREGDGVMTVWVTSAKTPRKFTRREVETGSEQGGYVRITSGVKPGELVAGDGALFLDNALAIAADGAGD